MVRVVLPPDVGAVVAATRRAMWRSGLTAICSAPAIALALLSLALDGPAMGLFMLAFAGIVSVGVHRLLPLLLVHATGPKGWRRTGGVLELTDQGVAIETTGARRAFTWASITKIDPWSGGVILRRGWRTLICIPASAFQGQEKESFVAQARAFHRGRA